ncbi:MAG: GTP pyrophosphokinase family protein [Clostridiales bacterium]|nr:GTP pyrophosphokinase family protein [Candidatus Scatonaster coprocaballi]
MEFEENNPFSEEITSALSTYQEDFVRNNLMSDAFLDFVEENTKPIDQLFAYYRCAIMEVETKFKVLDESLSVELERNPIESIKSRVKSVDSLLRKMRKKNVPLNLDAIEENIHDIAGVRVICSFPDDIYELADAFLAQDDITLISRKDYIKSPKPSGYRSLHLIVEVPIFLKDEKHSMKVEVQFRTIAMDFWASLEHKLHYKHDLPPERAQVLAEELRVCAEQIELLDLRMQAVRNEIVTYNEENPKDSSFPGFPDIH